MSLQLLPRRPLLGPGGVAPGLSSEGGTKELFSLLLLNSAIMAVACRWGWACACSGCGAGLRQSEPDTGTGTGTLTQVQASS